MGKELSPETRAFIDAHAGDNIQRLALQAARHPKVDAATAIIQIAARQKAKDKLPTWWQTNGLRYPQHLAMEQCSSEVTARYKATLIHDDLKQKGGFTDLTGGFGVDFCCMAKGFAQATYVERQEQLCGLAEENFPVLGLPNATIVHADAYEHLSKSEAQSVIYIDPARRDTKGKKTVLLTDCEPDITRIYSTLLEKAQQVIVKVSPMLDITQALHQLPHVSAVHVVAVAGECKELLLVMEPTANSENARIHCVNLPATLPEVWPIPFCFSLKEEAECESVIAEKPLTFLYEPNAAILKAGAFKMTGRHYGISKLHPNSHLYTSAERIEEFPGRCFEVMKHGGFGKRELRELHDNLTKANLTVRNFPASVEELRKKLKLADGGEDYLFATTLANGDKQWIWCRKIKS